MNVTMTVYDRTTGEVRRHIEGSPDTVAIQPLLDDEAMVFGAFDHEAHYVSQGRAMDRPPLPAIEAAGCGFVCAEAVPDGTTVRVVTAYSDIVAPVAGDAFRLQLPVEAEVTISGPWPYRVEVVVLGDAPFGGPDTAQVIEADVPAMRAHYAERTREESYRLVEEMLGNPSAKQRETWRLKRSVHDRYLAGSETTADAETMAAAVRYSGATVEDELAAISGKVAAEDWVTMRADGLRRETLIRLETAGTAPAILDVIAWAEAESGEAVAEARQKIEGDSP